MHKAAPFKAVEVGREKMSQQGLSDRGSAGKNGSKILRPMAEVKAEAPFEAGCLLDDDQWFRRPANGLVSHRRFW